MAKREMSRRANQEFKARLKRLSSNFTCFYCKTSIKCEALTFDHLIPLSRGGTSQQTNLAISCKFCNELKRDLTLEEFRELVNFKDGFTLNKILSSQNTVQL